MSIHSGLFAGRLDDLSIWVWPVLFCHLMWNRKLTSLLPPPQPHLLGLRICCGIAGFWWTLMDIVRYCWNPMHGPSGGGWGDCRGKASYFTLSSWFPHYFSYHSRPDIWGEIEFVFKVLQISFNCTVGICWYVIESNLPYKQWHSGSAPRVIQWSWMGGDSEQTEGSTSFHRLFYWYKLLTACCVGQWDPGFQTSLEATSSDYRQWERLTLWWSFGLHLPQEHWWNGTESSLLNKKEQVGRSSQPIILFNLLLPTFHC